ncbi:MAG: CRISPR-associated endonuclease Cas3'' [Bacteroidales bacterium]|nr:CRISPR-associated endonuclease Cas3'' [Bacteroidales bacterium]
MSDLGFDEVLAKSEPPVTLEQHVKDCLEVLNNLKCSVPNLPKTINKNRFWKLLKLCILLHDLGKAHIEFQKKLRGQKNSWHNQRHELFSLPFIRALSETDEENELMQLIIAGHHKSFNELFDFVDKNYKSNENGFGSLIELDDKPTFKESFTININSDKLQSYFKSFGLNPILTSAIENPKEFIKKYIVKTKNTLTSEFIEKILLIGAFKQCDHLGSAGIFNIKQLNSESFSFLHSSSFSFYEHQRRASQVIGNVILTSPTGSGKTETALLWLQKQIDERGQGRTFYILPFTASINAMYERLNKKMGDGCCGMQHSRIAEYFESKFEDDDYDEISNEKKKQLLDEFRSVVTPLRIVTPFLYIIKHTDHPILSMLTIQYYDVDHPR